MPDNNSKVPAYLLIGGGLALFFFTLSNRAAAAGSKGFATEEEQARLEEEIAEIEAQLIESQVLRPRLDNTFYGNAAANVVREYFNRAALLIQQNNILTPVRAITRRPENTTEMAAELNINGFNAKLVPFIIPFDQEVTLIASGVANGEANQEEGWVAADGVGVTILRNFGGRVEEVDVTARIQKSGVARLEEESRADVFEEERTIFLNAGQYVLTGVIIGSANSSQNSELQANLNFEVS